MTDVPFHLTRMGQRFYEATLPDLVTQLERLNTNIERLLTLVPQQSTPAPEPKQEKAP